MVDQLIRDLVPIFAAGLAIQQLLEILDPIVVRAIGEKDKRLVLGLVSMAIGLLIAFGTGMRVLRPMGLDGYDIMDAVLTAMIISAGTEGFNSILKFLGYAKEGKKSDAAALKAWVAKDPDAEYLMDRIDRKPK
ncbi:MAG: hypothetical protein GKC10_05290 [Methanosarcinales archaeon]|nr:hypothetical protein [Methanosarcinales archaeon]